MSWQGRRKKVLVKCRLDRALANEDWHELFPCSHTEYLGPVGSDHRPVVAYLENKVVKRRGHFRFDKRWIGLDSLLESIERGWGEMSSENSRDLVSKIMNYRHEITIWRKSNPPFGKAKISELQKAL